MGRLVLEPKKSSLVGRGLQSIGNLKITAHEIANGPHAVYAEIVFLNAADCDVPTSALSPLSVDSDEKIGHGFHSRKVRA